jgi:hypothetical protein
LNFLMSEWRTANSIRSVSATYQKADTQRRVGNVSYRARVRRIFGDASQQAEGTD